MSASVLEATLAALVSALNTGRPAGVPVIERDRWVDVEAGPATMPVVALTGWEDEPHSNQNDDRLVDFRTVKVNFEIYAVGGATTTASQAVDEIVQWIATQCGTTEGNALVATGAIRAAIEKKIAVVGKGNVCRCLVEVAIDYRNLVNDLTRAK